MPESFKPLNQLSASSPLSDWLSTLEQMHPKAIDMGLERVRKVAERLDLESTAVKFVVAGTNGKGSTCAMLEAIVMAAGYKVGMYTSPHLIDFNERARINGEPASDQALTEAFAVVASACNDVSLTYFEFTTLAILWLFARSGLDVYVLEVGLGGRLDAVNIVDADCSIVTSVDIDHVEWLGNTREEIALEKAHVYRPGRPAICADPVPPATLVEYASSIGADLWLFGRDFNYSGDRQQWAFAGRHGRRHSLGYPALRGANQLLNACAALAALESVKDRLIIPLQSVRQGLLQAALPGRFQIIPGQPLLILDVAHNPHAASVLEKNLSAMGYYPYTHAVLGMLSDKDITEVVRRVASKVDHWYCASLPGARGVDGEKLKSLVQQALQGLQQERPDLDLSAVTVQAFPSARDAYEAARSAASVDDRIVAFGSFLTVGDILAHLGRR